ncbi:DUF4384 domain-containing protein, partial [Myxococcota bacterium]|nr:DUF4384 domain-containing protein [Myxococcota bacterium]
SEVLHPGDVLRFTAMLPEHGYVFIANVDANGRVSRYFPENSARSAEVPRGLPRTLPGSIELDDFIGLERITLLSSDGPLDEADVFAALARAYERAGGDLTRMAAPALDAAEHAVVIRKAPKAAP